MSDKIGVDSKGIWTEHFSQEVEKKQKEREHKPKKFGPVEERAMIQAMEGN